MAVSTAEQAQRSAGVDVIEVDNPATGELVGSVPKLSPEQVAELVAKARAAQPAWEALGFDARARIFRRAKQWMITNRERMAQTIISETGKTYEDAGLEIPKSPGQFPFKHYRTPPSRAEVLPGFRAIYVFGDPRDCVASLFRRDLQPGRRPGICTVSRSIPRSGLPLPSHTARLAGGLSAKTSLDRINRMSVTMISLPTSCLSCPIISEGIHVNVTGT